jgi:hypothetical protein
MEEERSPPTYWLSKVKLKVIFQHQLLVTFITLSVGQEVENGQLIL